jgi:hypothetical protein
MIYKKTTQIPNIVLDQYLRTLNASELKVLLVIIRQTNGWIDKRTGKRKTRDRISHSQFKDKKGLCTKIISKATQSLVLKGLITVTDGAGNELSNTLDRKGNPRLFYSYQPSYFIPPTMVQSSLGLVYKSIIDKTNCTKLHNVSKEKN